MKVSIITMTSTYNYGATLQAYALQEFIKSMGHTCNLIDHMSRKEKHRKIKLSNFSRENIKMIPYKFQLERGYKRFEDFYDKYMNMTQRYPIYQLLKESPPDSDVFITGSDQVWNPRDSKYERFFLDFVPRGKKRISYAASIGDKEIPEDMKNKYMVFLSKFDGISVREIEGQKIISALTEKNVNVNIDPVFLLEKEKWYALESPVSGLGSGYILCYFIYMPSWINELIEMLRKMTGLKVIFVGLHGLRKAKYDRYIRDAGPREFLWLIDNASLVISSSFHGNAFSILFEKDFIAIPDPKRPDRIHNLLRLFGMENHELYENSINYVSKCDHYNHVRNIIINEREKARQYLERHLE